MGETEGGGERAGHNGRLKRSQLHLLHGHHPGERGGAAIKNP
jgi:hypothetical protein